MEHSESEGKRTHREKYEALAHVVGIKNLEHTIRFHGVTREMIEEALSAGDEHLNTIPLELWDRMALSTGAADKQFPKRPISPAITFAYPWTKLKEPQSLSMRVCMLKHVAKHYIATKEK